MSDYSPRLGVELLPPGAVDLDQPFNNLARQLDQVLNVRVLSATTATQPGAPATGALYILPTSPSGANWTGKAAGTLALFDSGMWYFTTPKGFIVAHVADTGAVVQWTGSAWANVETLLGAKGADLASAATVTLASATGDYVHVTGTVSITSFGAAKAGLERTLVHDAAHTLTHGANVINLSGANVTPSAGDISKWRSEGGTVWRMVDYHRADGKALVAAPNVQIFTTSGTWNKPAGASRVRVLAVGGGCGGGSGRVGAAGTVRCGGGGGAASPVTITDLSASVLGSSESVTVGAAGVGGAAVTTNDTDGNPGTSGTGSSFGAHVRGWPSTSGGGGGGTNASGVGGAVGGPTNSGSAGGGASASVTGGAGTSGGAPGYGSIGGGSGGGISAANAASAGGSAAFNVLGLNISLASNGGAIATNGGNGATHIALDSNFLGQGGGGGGSSTVLGGNGGHGSGYGAGGGGGGAALNGATASGAGGNGSPGIVVVVTYF